MSPSRQLSLQLGPVDPAARQLAREMDLAAGAAFLTEQLLEIVFPDRLEDAGLRELVSRYAYENLAAMWRVIAGLDDPLEVNPPRGAVEFNDAAAQIGLSPGQVERIHRVGAGLVWTLWFRAASAHAEANDIPLGRLLAGPSMIVHAFIDGQVSTLLERHEAAHAEYQHARTQLRLAILGQVLAGTSTLRAWDIERSLGISLDADHLAVAIRLERSVAEESLLGELRLATEADAIVPYRHNPDTWLVWIIRRDGFGTDRLAAVTAVLERSGLRAGLGTNARGRHGLSSTAQEALEASALQERLGEAAPRVVSFDELRLESLLLVDPAGAARFVRAELRALDADDARSATLRTTAQTWLTSGSNVMTAQVLGVHEHTVRNRMTTIQDVIGRPLTARRTELLVALRLRRLLEAQHPA